jgi:chaperone required for assembly of F1-ATPase
MREIFTEIFENHPLDPTEAARRGVRPRLRKRFFKHARADDAGEGRVAILLDGKPVLTPSRRRAGSRRPSRRNGMRKPT